MTIEVRVPDVGEAEEVEVIEILVKVGDSVGVDDSLIVLESDKASMEIPSTHAGKITAIKVSLGDKVDEGDVILTIEAANEDTAESARKDDVASKDPAPVATSPEKENEKESPASGEKTSRVDAPGEETPGEETPGKEAPGKEARGKEAPGKEAPGKEAPVKAATQSSTSTPATTSGIVYAGPAVRQQAREYGVDLTEVKGSGRKSRILKEDVQSFVRTRMQSKAGTGAGIPPIPTIDFSKFGETELAPLSRVRRASARNLHRNWLNIPHVTQFDEADITDLEAFRKLQNDELKAAGVKVTPLAFLIKASVHALTRYPRFNASLDASLENLILKQYFNIGIAVETDDGLVVPVLKNADQKGVIDLATESAELARLARDRKLPLDAMQGATFTISSLGGIGGTAFTPIINAPEVAILGVSRSKTAPVFDGNSFVPRTMLPLSLSYDHRAIDGAEAARFTRYLAEVLSDIRRLVM
jgi:pyruvate dehydrogenase E2 component (dihydrolipoamide acetyltransferase)